MRLLVGDSCILIDVIDGDLVDELFRLPFEFGVPDILYEGELRDRHPDLPRNGLRVFAMTAERLQEASELRTTYPAASINDLLALILARDHQTILLTGDRNLRQAADEVGVQVHGTIWLVERMLEHDLIDVVEAERSFEAMIRAGSRLPRQTIRRRLARWST